MAPTSVAWRKKLSCFGSVYLDFSPWVLYLGICLSMMRSDPCEIDDVVLAFLKAVDSCEPVDPQEWLDRYPQFADQLSPFFEYQNRFAHLARLRIDTSESDGAGAPAAIDLPGFGVL